MTAASLTILTISNVDLTTTQGSGSVVLSYQEGLQKTGWNNNIYTPHSFNSLKIFKNRLFIYRFSILSLLALINELLIKKRKFDIVEFYGEENWLAIIFLNTFLKKQKYFHHSNGPSTIAFIHRKLTVLAKISNYLATISVTKSKNILLVSKFCMQHVIEDLKVTPCKVFYINNGLDESYRNLSIDYSMKENIILFVGNFISIKGKEQFVKIINSVLATKSDWSVKVIGNNSPKQINLFDSKIRSRITFVGSIKDREQLSFEYRRAKVLLMPSIIETFGLVFCEAMAHKCLVISRPVGFLAECTKDEVVTCIGELEVVTLDIIDNQQKLKTIANNGYLKVQNLIWAKSIKEYDVYIRSLL